MTAVSPVDLLDLGRFLEAKASLRSDFPAPKETRILRARLEFETGSAAEAHRQASGLLQEQLTYKERASCWDIIGRVELTGGQFDSGLRAMHQASQAADHSQDPRLVARLLASYCEGLLHFKIESVEAELGRLRRAAIATGDPFSMIAFHTLNAELNAKRGAIGGAKKSTDTARSLLQEWPNLWQLGRLANVRSGIHIIESDYEEALSATLQALRYAEQSGSRRVRIPALGNLAHIKYVQGRLQDADEAVETFLLLVQKGGNTHIAALDTQFQIAVAKGAYALARRLAEDLQVTSGMLEEGRSYHGLWYTTNRIKWLYRIGRAEEGLALAVESLPTIEKISDRNLRTRIKMLIAEGMAHVGRADHGVLHLADGVCGFQRQSLDMVGDAMRVKGILLAQDDRSISDASFGRAYRVFNAAGNVTARDDVKRDSNATEVGTAHAPIVDDDSASKPRTANSRELTVTTSVVDVSLVHRLADILHLAMSPPLMAREFLTLISECQVANSAEVEITKQVVYNHPQSPFQSSGSSSRIRVFFGTHRGDAVEVVATPRPTAYAKTTLLALDRLARIAVNAHQFDMLDRESAGIRLTGMTEQELGLITASEKIVDLVKTIRRVADSNVTILLTGETGVGKELFARAVHLASPRSTKTFLPFNCTAVARDMFDSQLFGHKKGSFTGAHEDAPGVIRAAAGGTLFLDEIGEMSLDVQPKLLRFLESGEIQPLGDPQPRLVDVRIVAATNARLDQLVSDGRFREDLFYRLNVIRIDIPPLRERREEIPALVQHFLEKFGRELQKPMLRIADETLEYLVLYRWPGNVRQLANEIRRMVAMAEPGSVLMPAHLADDIASSRKTLPAAAPRPRDAHEILTRIDQPLAAAVDHVERAAIKRAMTLCDGRLEDAARLLGLSRKGLYLKRQRLNLE
jgi:DNA-binding NtrC family response regulator/tetratricopeptide (TPR) repeat protein